MEFGRSPITTTWFLDACELADPVYGTALRHKAAVYERCRQMQKSPDHGARDVAQSMMRFMDGDSRSVSYETLNYLQGTGATATLITQGGGGEGIVERIVAPESDPDHSVSDALMWNPPSVTLNVLKIAGVERYIATHPDAFKTLKKTIETTGLVEPQHSEIHSRLRAIEQAVLAQANRLAPGPKVDFVLHGMAVGIDKDPVLAAAFDKTNRTKILADTADFLDGYLAWAINRAQHPHPQNFGKQNPLKNRQVRYETVPESFQSMPKPTIQIPGLEIGEEIGRGGHSILYRAAKDGKKYVVKVLRDEGPFRTRPRPTCVFKGREPLSRVFTIPG